MARPNRRVLLALVIGCGAIAFSAVHVRSTADPYGDVRATAMRCLTSFRDVHLGEATAGGATWVVGDRRLETWTVQFTAIGWRTVDGGIDIRPPQQGSQFGSGRGTVLVDAQGLRCLRVAFAPGT